MKVLWTIWGVCSHHTFPNVWNSRIQEHMASIDAFYLAAERGFFLKDSGLQLKHLQSRTILGFLAKVPLHVWQGLLHDMPDNALSCHFLCGLHFFKLYNTEPVNDHLSDVTEREELNVVLVICEVDGKFTCSKGRFLKFLNFWKWNLK